MWPSEGSGSELMPGGSREEEFRGMRGVSKYLCAFCFLYVAFFGIIVPDHAVM